MQRSPTVRLSIMMFLQYAVWGAWLPTAGLYLTSPKASGGLGFEQGDLGMILGIAGAIGAIAAPFIAGQFADRYFATERFMAVVLALGGVVNWVLASQTSVSSWLWLSVVYSVLYMPTLALSNSMAFANLTDSERDFPKVRIWGTIGWIAASWAFPMIWMQTGLHGQALPPFIKGVDRPDAIAQIANSLRFSGGLALFYAVFCLALPHTPPKRDAVEPLAFKRALGLLARPSFAVLVATSLLISVIHNIYFMQTSSFLPTLGLDKGTVGPAMTIGQFAEIGVMALLGMMLKRLGAKGVIAIGIGAYVLRYAIWSQTSLPMEILVASQALHGVCYACFFAAAYIYVDRIAPVDVRHSAQTVFGILILGAGPVVGGWLNGKLAGQYPAAGVEGATQAIDYSPFWLFLAGIAAFAFLFFLLLFRDESQPASDTSAPA